MDILGNPNEIRDDWAARENIEIICTSIKTVVEFLNRFHSSCRLRLAELDNRLKRIEKSLDLMDANLNYNVSVQGQLQSSNLTSNETRSDTFVHQLTPCCSNFHSSQHYLSTGLAVRCFSVKDVDSTASVPT
ncbi:unnamed protein product [Schistocephalus solidus]|uniref:BRICK1 n=1 Tax=Schistocephalus solidus TaxID=70667 RepID=A0A183TRU4_SCHSO|nr:unnamed protein product [Schistocephalus solidus]